jgi:hypothetical protein
MMMHWHLQQWHLWPMVAAVVVVIAINCAAVVDGGMMMQRHLQ